MSTQELTWRVSIDPATAIAEMRRLAGVSSTVTSQITADVRAEAAAAVVLQKQRSSALIAEWKAETAARVRESKQSAQAVINEEKSLAAQMIREARAATAVREQEAKRGAQVEIAAQRQRSAAAAQAAASQLQIFASTRDQASATSKAFDELGDHLNIFVGQRIPIAGGLFVRLTQNLRNFSAEAQLTQASVLRLGRAIDAISSGSGKPSSEIQSFLQTFALIETQSGKDTAAIEFFGAATAQKLIPQLKAANSEMVALSASAPEAAGGLAGVLAAMGPVGIAAAGIAVEMIAAGIAIGIIVKVGESAIETFFGLAKSAAGFRGEMLDLSQQLGISTETLSAFEILAKTTGGDLGSISASLGIFQKNLEEAQDPTSKQAKLFHELGVETEDTEQALRDTLKQLAAMPEGFHQTATALELFGRGGKSVLAILKEMHGDLDGAIDRFREMGLIVSREDAVAADKFNDQLALLQFQFRALVGKEAIPAATKALEELSRFLKDNKAAVDALGFAIRILGLGVEGMIKNFVGGAETIQGFAQVVLRAIPGLEQTALLYERIAKAKGFKEVLPGVTGGAGGVSLTEGVTAGVEGVELPPKRTGLTEAQKNAQAELQILQTASQNAQRIAQFESEGLRQQFEQRKLTLKEYTDAVIEQAGKELAARQRVTDEERRQANILPARQRRVELAKIALEEEKDQDAFVLASAKAHEAQRKQEEAAELALNKQLVAIRDAQREGELERNRQAADRGALDRSLAIAEQIKIEKAAFDDRMTLLDIEVKQTGTTAERLIEIDNQRLESQQRFTDAFKRLTQQRLDAMAAEQAKAIELKLPGDFDPNKVPTQNVGLPPDVTSAMIIQAQAAQGAFNGLGVAISQVLGLSVTAGQAIGDVLAGAFSQLAQAVGQAVQSFVLFGKVEGGFKKFTATLLASIAAQAAVQAVYQAAQGLAWLALAYFTGNPAYHKAGITALVSAGIFASVAGVAAGAGRAVAGNAFNNATGGGSGSDGGSSQPLQTIVQGRNQRGGSGGSSSPVVVHFDIRHDEGVIVRKWVDDYNNGGVTRETIGNDGR